MLFADTGAQQPNRMLAQRRADERSRPCGAFYLYAGPREIE
jgi:hypothetical protein